MFYRNEEVIAKKILKVTKLGVDSLLLTIRLNLTLWQTFETGRRIEVDGHYGCSKNVWLTQPVVPQAVLPWLYSTARARKRRKTKFSTGEITSSVKLLHTRRTVAFYPKQLWTQLPPPPPTAGTQFSLLLKLQCCFFFFFCTIRSTNIMQRFLLLLIIIVVVGAVVSETDVHTYVPIFFNVNEEPKR